MDIVLIESGFVIGDLTEASSYAKACVRNALLRGEAPFHVSALYLDCVDVHDDAGLAAAAIAAKKVTEMADRVAIYIDNGITDMVRSIVDHANSLHIPVSYRSLRRPDADLPVAHISEGHRVEQRERRRGLRVVE